MEKHVIAKFEKVSYEEFKKSLLDEDITGGLTLPDDLIRNMYDTIKLPKRATKGSAGYDFFYPLLNTAILVKDRTLKIPTGIKCKIDENWGLFLYPRSGHGFKYRIQLDNTVGIIDSDYYNNKNNEGHIFIKLTNDSKIRGKFLKFHHGDAMCQGIFHSIGFAEEDEVTDIREGGFGSTSK